MRLDPRRVQDLRTIVLMVIRLVALWLITWGALQIVARLLFGVLGVKQLSAAWTTWTGIGEEHGIYRGLATIGVGVPLALASRLLSRWIVRPPETTCPRCAYEGAGAQGDICTECGLAGWQQN